jgi:hypothetical protein
MCDRCGEAMRGLRSDQPQLLPRPSALEVPPTLLAVAAEVIE